MSLSYQYVNSNSARSAPPSQSKHFMNTWFFFFVAVSGQGLLTAEDYPFVCCLEQPHMLNNSWFAIYWLCRPSWAVVFIFICCRELSGKLKTMVRHLFVAMYLWPWTAAVFEKHMICNLEVSVDDRPFWTVINLQLMRCRKINHPYYCPTPY